jgi:hypothetical protein
VKKARGELRENLKTRKRIAITVFAGVLILIGMIGQFIPIFPGKIVLFAGLLILSMYAPSVHAWVKQRLSSHPRLESLADRFRNRLIRLFHK